MIRFLKGRVILKDEDSAIIRCGDVGFEVFFSKKNLKRIKEGETIEIFVFLDVTEKFFRLYGFWSRQELDLFKFLKQIPGVGAKASLEISSFGSIEKLKKEIDEKQDKVFEGITGIGPKKVRKILLEVSGYLVKYEKSKEKKDEVEKDEVFWALKELGFKEGEIKKALLQIPQDISDSQEKIKIALKFLSNPA